MKKSISLLVFVFLTTIASAQFYIKGTMTPPEKDNWVILHKLQGIKPKYIANTTIKFDTISVGTDKQVLGRFSFELPKNTAPGMYRVTYRNRGNGFVDFIFNKENIEFIFNPKFPDQSVVFTSSRENKLHNEYLEAYSVEQKKVNDFQIEYLKSLSKESKKGYKKAKSALEDVQEKYENKSEGMLVNSFIKGNPQYNPSSPFDNQDEYFESAQENFFKNVDFEDKTLYNSSFLINKINDFVIYLNYSDDQVTQQKLHKSAIAKVMDVVSGKKIEKEITEFLIITFTERRNSEIVDWMFSEYYDKMANKDPNFKTKKLDQLSVSVGRTAPDFSWKEGEADFKLSTLNDGQRYLLIFWSTGCPHCVKELPEVHEFMGAKNTTSVITFAIEDNDVEFNKFKEKLAGWHNTYGTHPDYKFDNEVVQKYKIEATPTYFILDRNKKIVAIPNTIEDVKKYFNGL